MADMSRDELLRQVRKNLVDRDFAARFTPMTEDGHRPIVAALLEDTIDELCAQVRAAGGAANVVVRMFDGLIVFNLVTHSNERPAPRGEKSSITSTATVGVILQQLAQDGGEMTYKVCTPSASGGTGVVDGARILALA